MTYRVTSHIAKTTSTITKPFWLIKTRKVENQRIKFKSDFFLFNLSGARPPERITTIKT